MRPSCSAARRWIWRTSSASRKRPPSTIRWPGARWTAFRTRPARAGFAMDLFTQLFGGMLTFVYHCFDRIVIYGYLSGLSRPERVVNFFRQVAGVPVLSKEVLSQRTADYQNWVRPMHAIIASRSSGPRRACARNTMSCRGNAAWCGRIATASTASSRAWSRGRRFASPSRNTQPRIPITASLPATTPHGRLMVTGLGGPADDAERELIRAHERGSGPRQGHGGYSLARRRRSSHRRSLGPLELHRYPVCYRLFNGE